MPTQTTTKKVAAKKVPVKKAEPADNTTTALTISGAEHEPANRPSSFKALKPNELRYAAELFGVDNDSPVDEVILANLESDGITWKMYAERMNLPGWQELPEDDSIDFPEPLEDWDEAEEVEVTETIITRAPVQTLNEGKYLIKFIGENWYFEHGKYSFSKDSPYALMNARDAQNALVGEPSKFRQAYPDELESFYDKS